MKRTAVLLYHSVLEREQLLCRLSPISFLELDCKKLEGKECMEYRAPVICFARDLPTALHLKQQVSCPYLLLFCPPSLLGMCSLLEDAHCRAQSLSCSVSTLQQTLLCCTDVREKECVQEQVVALTRREEQVLALMISGQDIQSIALILGIKRSTVVAHKKHMFLKSGVHTTSQLVVWAMLKQVC
ncbi:helix-turn-helix transcriptional regulator [Sphaerochaeta globosa]|jgi:DNA-binding CsgD family transcriptional regulator|nr:helix-turn-helix transcriptional regulator [Sphaerochaeta globosa]